MDIENQDQTSIQYIPPLGQVVRFQCPANEEHSKYLNSFEMYKYHIKFCRELRNISETFLCKFCFKLFLESEQRDSHQSKCSCRLVPENIEFIMPDHLKQKYPQNRITFDNQDEFFEILDSFPEQEPLSMSIFEGKSIKSDFEEDDGDDDCCSMKKIDNCCIERDSNHVFSDDQIEFSDTEQIQGEQSQQTESDDIQCNKISISEISQQVNILTFKEDFNPSSKTSKEDNENERQPSKKFSSKIIRNIVKKKDNFKENLQKTNSIQSNSQNEIQSQTTISHQSKQNMNQELQQKSLEDQMEQAKKRLDNQINQIEDTEEYLSKSKFDALLDLTNLSLEDQQYEETQKINKLIEPQSNQMIDENQKPESQTPHKKKIITDKKKVIENQCDLSTDPIFEYIQISSQSKSYLNINIQECLDIKQICMQEEIVVDLNNFQSLQYNNQISFKQWNSYFIMNLSEYTSQPHLIAMLSVNDYRSIEYLYNKFLISESEQICLIQTTQNRLQDYFKSIYPLIYNDERTTLNNNIYILTLENSKILEKDFISKAPQQKFQNNDSSKMMMKQNDQMKGMHQQQNQNRNEKVNLPSCLKLNLYMYEGFQVWQNSLSENVVYLTSQLTKDFIINVANDLQISKNMKSYDRVFQQLNEDLQNCSSQRQEKLIYLNQIKEKLSQMQKTIQIDQKNRQKEEKQNIQDIGTKKNGYQANCQKNKLISQEVVDLTEQVNKLQSSLAQEIEKTFISAKEKSDQIYKQQVEKHRQDVISLAQENISDKIQFLEQLRFQNQKLAIEQQKAHETQRKSGQKTIQYQNRINQLQQDKQIKQKNFLIQKNKQQTSYLCLLCKKYPQNCLQKPCGHILCCYSCMSKENEDKGKIFCKICKIEIVKFSEIKYKVQMY